MSTEPKLAKYVIFINGPPGVGKDTAAGAIMAFVHHNASWMNPRHMKIAEPIKRATHILFGCAHFNTDRFDDPAFAKYKDVPLGEFFGLSPRAAYITVSTLIRNEMGIEHFGWLQRRHMDTMHSTQVYVFSDCGFAEELSPIVDMVGEKNVLIIELSADGKSFANDSRSYISEALCAKYPNIKVRKIVNEFGDLQDRELFKVYCKGAAKSFLQIEERE